MHICKYKYIYLTVSDFKASNADRDMADAEWIHINIYAYIVVCIHVYMYIHACTYIYIYKHIYISPSVSDFKASNAVRDMADAEWIRIYIYAYTVVYIHVYLYIRECICK